MKHKLFRTAQIIVCICLAAGVLGGCQNAQGLSDLTIIQGVGIDKSDDKTKVSLQYLNLNKSSSADSIGDKITAVASGEDQTVNGAIFNASKVLSKSMFFGQNKIIVFGSDYIQDDLRRGADYLIRSVDSRPDVLLALSSEKASDIIESKENDARIPTESIYELLTVGEQNGYSAAVTVNQLQNLYIDGMTDVYLPILSPGEDCVKCDGIAVFSKENYAATLNDDETFGFLLIKGRAKGGTLEIESSSLGNICAQISKASSKRSATVKNGKITYTCTVSVQLMLDEIQRGISTAVTPDQAKKIERLFEDKVKNMCIASLKKCAQNKSDPFMISRSVAKSDINLYNSLKANWRNELNNIDYRVNVSASLQLVKDNSHRD